jgi:multicomponent Na+:H+ antiporter subunit D
MMEPITALLATMVLPLLAFVLCLLTPNRHNIRDGGTFIIAVLLFGSVLNVLYHFNSGTPVAYEAITFQAGLSIAFSVEPLGMVFALVASSLWIATHVYGIGYMRGNKEQKHARFFACFAFAIFATMGIAFSANLLTLFLFYELLTISTYPLVAHKENDAAKKGARTYLGILMGTSIAFLLTAVVWTYAIAGNLDFKLGGLFEPTLSPMFTAVLLAFFAFGIGKAALMPFHRWLPAAMVAPTPVSALLHAVAVVKAGVFSMLKVGVYVFGIDNLSSTGASDWLMWLAAFSILAASFVAMAQDNLKRRLAYSTVGQLSYITLGVALATSMGVIGGGLHIVTHAFGKITLFMCAGAIYVATHKTNISEMRGLGRAMPFTFIAFGIGSLSIIGLPPFAGSWSKWMLLVAAADTQQIIIIGVLLLSSILNVAYLVPIFARGFFSPASGTGSKALNANVPWREKIAEAPLLVVVPPCITALGCIVLFFYADVIVEFIAPIATVPSVETTNG